MNKIFSENNEKKQYKKLAKEMLHVKHNKKTTEKKNKFIKRLKYFPGNKQNGSINTGKRNVTRETK